MEVNDNNPDSDLIYGNNCPYIGIQWRAGRIFVSNAVLRLLGNPEKIRILWNPAKLVLAIEPTHVDDPDGFPVNGRNYVKNGSFVIGSVTLLHVIWKTIDWDKTLRYRVVARYNETSNVAIFDMRTAIASEIPKNIHGGKPKRMRDI